MDLQNAYQLLEKLRLFQVKLDTTNYVMNTCYAEAFLNKIKDTTDPEVLQLFSIPFVAHLTRLLTTNIVLCENYHISVRIFFIKVLGHVCAVELYFVKVFAISSDYVKNCFKDIHSPKLNHSVRLAFLELAVAIIDHGSGMDWLLESGAWKDILTFVNNNKRTLLVDRHVYLFASKFMWKLNDIGDINNLNKALNVILAPIEEFGIVNQEILSDEYENEICKTIVPMFQMLLAIFSEKDRIRTSSLLMRCLLTERLLMNKLGICMNKLRSAEMVLMCSKISYWSSMGNIFLFKPLVPGVVYTKEDLRGLFIFYYHTLKLLTQRRNIKLVTEFNIACFIIWESVWQKNPPFTKDNNRSLDMENHMMFISLVPLLMWAIKVKNFTEFMEEDMVVKTVMALMNNIHIEHTSRATYDIRSIIYEEEPSIIQTVTQSVKLLNSLVSHVTDKAATLLFRCLFYILCEFNEQQSNSELRCSKTDIINMVSQVMEVLLSVLKHYNITWNESLEVLQLYSIVHGILKKPDLPSKFVVVLLTTLSYSVSKFLTPNLSLLLESTPGSELHDIGSLIKLKMNDEEWEVRDSALELLYVCTDLCFIKYPPFQKQIIDEKLIVTSARLAFDDPESYVQATALRCLGAAARVPCVWEQTRTECRHVQEQLLSRLQLGADGTVRKEACGVLCEVYQHVKLAPAARRRLHDHMASAALSDFYWEVQLGALRFWRMVIKTLLTDQGMLDGSFPSVTFSKQSRKIVSLNPAEIQRRLTSVLEELSSIGCLTVLVKLLNEDNQMEIMELALDISLELIEILDKYKMPECVTNESVEDLTVQLIEDDEAMDFSPSSSDSPDSVSDEMLTTEHVNLLSNIYERTMSIEPEPKIKPKIRLVRKASPNLFVSHVKSKDFKDIIEQKRQRKNGRRSMAEIIDDIVGYEHNAEVNTLDCY